MENKKIQFNIDFGKHAFFAENAVVSHSSSKFVIDFIQTMPRFDQFPGIKDPKVTMAVRHNTLIMDIIAAKEFFNVLNENIKKFETKFGEIRIPKKEIKQETSIEEYEQPTSSRSYIG